MARGDCLTPSLTRTTSSDTHSVEDSVSEDIKDRDKWVSVWEIVRKQNEIFGFYVPSFSLQKDAYYRRDSIESLLHSVNHRIATSSDNKAIYCIYDEVEDCDICFEVKHGGTRRQDTFSSLMYAWKQRDGLISRVERFHVQVNHPSDRPWIDDVLPSCMSDYLLRATGRYW